MMATSWMVAKKPSFILSIWSSGSATVGGRAVEGKGCAQNLKKKI